MRESSFESLVSGFVRLERELNGVELSNEVRAGAWLRQTLGLSLTAVGLAYQDGFWAERFLGHIDTRSPSEMIEWDGRVSRAWARRNPSLIPEQIRAKWVSRQKLDDHTKEVDWRLIAESIDWTVAGPWGPGRPGNISRLRRAQALFVLTRLISAEVDMQAAFSFMLGENRELVGFSPLTFVGAFSFTRFEEALLAAERYLGGLP